MVSKKSGVPWKMYINYDPLVLFISTTLALYRISPKIRGMVSTKFATSWYYTCVQSINALRVMESGSKIVSANVRIELSCELAASSSQDSWSSGNSIAASASQNSLPGGSFMEVNTDMKKYLRGGFVYLDATPQKETKELFFSQVS